MIALLDVGVTNFNDGLFFDSSAFSVDQMKDAWCVVFFCVGGTVVAFCPAARTFVSNGMKQIGKAAAVAA